jgi:hypothetical protein
MSFLSILPFLLVSLVMLAVAVKFAAFLSGRAELGWILAGQYAVLATLLNACATYALIYPEPGASWIGSAACFAIPLVSAIAFFRGRARTAAGDPFALADSVKLTGFLLIELLAVSLFEIIYLVASFVH